LTRLPDNFRLFVVTDQDPIGNLLLHVLARDAKEAEEIARIHLQADGWEGDEDLHRNHSEDARGFSHGRNRGDTGGIPDPKSPSL